MSNLEEKIDTAKERIRELEILIQHWQDAVKNQTNTK
tara:strand:+ start:442 stop:552 length:111 start_codon:yes stop_codon:yes gene_type:complete